MGHDRKEEDKVERRKLSLLRQIVAAIGCLHATIIRIADSCKKGRRAVSFDYAVGLPKTKIKENMPLELKITTEQEIDVTITPKTDTGKPATLDGSPSWSVISGNAQVIVAEDGLSAALVSPDDPGDTVILIKADADLGEGVEEISDTITLQSVGATAKNLGLTASAPRPKREATPPV